MLWQTLVTNTCHLVWIDCVILSSSKLSAMTSFLREYTGLLLISALKPQLRWTEI